MAATGAATLIGKKLLIPEQAKAIQTKNIQYAYKPNICNFCANACGIKVRIASISGKPNRVPLCIDKYSTHSETFTYTYLT